ncbi:hypothetical protein TRFO_42301 [Tritrichomonas foetus]|uniref:Uncharacterized protein n=1 Tax=Tritrichomonas foetus TaxID=1144522 RepID=A0A1J4L1C5_9EUKA|nr:hypothetical protein TRFO_42301 [Tritrichomonas foetus]|eukprot:OHT15764.1 hypothetical protein TRFO_42301 [Tritrichomonas foetus]
MDFDDCDYSCQQVPSRSRDEKVLMKNRDMIEKTRLAARHENFERHQIVDNIIKPIDESSLAVDDVERFNRDYTQDQKKTKEFEYQRTWARAAHRHQQQVDYEKSIELRREEEKAAAEKIARAVQDHDFNRESTFYDPVTNVVPDETTEKGATQKTLDTRHEFMREARARRIQHNANSTQYDPITGELRSFW